MNTQETLAKLDAIQESLKHLPGEHDQKSHAGSRGGGKGTSAGTPSSKGKRVDSIDILDDQASERSNKNAQDVMITRQARAIESYLDMFDAKGSMNGTKGTFKIPKTTDTNEMFDTMADDGWEGEGSSGDNWTLGRGETVAELKGRSLTVRIG
jgi:hypothetical protein